MHIWMLFLLLLHKGVTGLKILSVDIPSHVQIGHIAIMKCKYELGRDELYSVKWYKGNNEFYRYVPKDKPPGQVFRLKGVKVNQTASNNHQVVLADVGLTTSGNYRCEVSAEAPSFQTESETKEMLVVAPPDEAPKISGSKSQYAIGDSVKIECSTVRSSPPANLSWFINGKKALDSTLHKYPPIRDEDGGGSSSLGLEFKLDHQHFENGSLNLRCVASIHHPFYTTSSEHFINSDPVAILENKRSHSQVSLWKNNSSRHCISYALIIISLLLR